MQLQPCHIGEDIKTSFDQITDHHRLMLRVLYQIISIMSLDHRLHIDRRWQPIMLINPIQGFRIIIRHQIKTLVKGIIQERGQ